MITDLLFDFAPHLEPSGCRISEKNNKLCVFYITYLNNLQNLKAELKFENTFPHYLRLDTYFREKS